MEKAQKEEQKAADKAEQLAAKAVLSQQARHTALAQQVIAKLANPIASMASILTSSESSQLPSFVLDTAKSHLNQLQVLCSSARAVVQDNTKTMAIDNMKDVSKLASDSKKSETLMTQMLASISRLTT